MWINARTFSHEPCYTKRNRSHDILDLLAMKMSFRSNLLFFRSKRSKPEANEKCLMMTRTRATTRIYRSEATGKTDRQILNGNEHRHRPMWMPCECEPFLYGLNWGNLCFNEYVFVYILNNPTIGLSQRMSPSEGIKWWSSYVCINGHAYTS